MDQLNKLVSKELVRGLLKLKFEKDGLCYACQKEKKTKVSLKSKRQFLPLECLNFPI